MQAQPPIGPDPDVEMIDIHMSEEEAGEIPHTQGNSVPAGSGLQREMRERDVQSVGFPRANEVKHCLDLSAKVQGRTLTSRPLNPRIRCQGQRRAEDVFGGAW